MPVLSNTIFLVMVGIVGLLVGLLIGYLFADREPKKAKEDGIPADLRKDGFSDVARLLYSPLKKRIITGMDGGFFREARELTSDQQTRLAKVIRIWGDWANRVTEQPVEAPVQAEPSTQEVALQAEAAVVAESAAFAAEPEPAQAESAPEPFDASSLYTPEEETGAASESTMAARPVVDLVNEEARTTETQAPETPAEVAEPETAPEPPAVKNQTIVEQINDVLQGKLAGTQYEHRALVLQDDMNNGVIVYIGSEKYAGIELVPYPDAQELIRDAVAEWEQKYEAGQSAPAQ